MVVIDSHRPLPVLGTSAYRDLADSRPRTPLRLLATSRSALPKLVPSRTIDSLSFAPAVATSRTKRELRDVSCIHSKLPMMLVFVGKFTISGL